MKADDRVDAWLRAYQRGEMSREEVREQMGEWFCLMPMHAFERLSVYADTMMAQFEEAQLMITLD